MRMGAGADMNMGANVKANGAAGLGAYATTHYLIECRDAGGGLKWTEEFHNLVVTAGLNDLLDKTFKASAYTASWYVGLTDGTPTFAAGDTMASHAGWVEVTDYDEGTREALTLGTVSSGSVNNSASKAEFTINATTTVGGAFVTTIGTKGGSTGTLYGGGAFAADRAVVDNDVLSVTVTLTVAAA